MFKRRTVTAVVETVIRRSEIIDRALEHPGHFHKVPEYTRLSAEWPVRSHLFDLREPSISSKAYELCPVIEGSGTSLSPRASSEGCGLDHTIEAVVETDRKQVSSLVVSHNLLSSPCRKKTKQDYAGSNSSVMCAT